MSKVIQPNPQYSVSGMGRHFDPASDQLYDPLRVIFTKPGIIQNHAPLTSIAARSSFVSQDYRILSNDDLHKFEQNIYIPRNTQLLPTQNLQPIRNQRFVAVDACERVLGPPITPQQLQLIRMQGVKKSQVLYQPGKIVQAKTSSLPPPLPNVEPTPEFTRYKSQNFETYGNHWDYKYNLYSMIDEPMNKCREFGLNGCGGCPSNQIIASRNRPQSLVWQD